MWLYVINTPHTSSTEECVGTWRKRPRSIYHGRGREREREIELALHVHEAEHVLRAEPPRLYIVYTNTWLPVIFGQASHTRETSKRAITSLFFLMPSPSSSPLIGIGVKMSRPPFSGKGESLELYRGELRYTYGPLTPAHSFSSCLLQILYIGEYRYFTSSVNHKELAPCQVATSSGRERKAQGRGPSTTAARPRVCLLVGPETVASGAASCAPC